jgi:hypothetical protein
MIDKYFLIAIFHVVVVAPTLLYVGFQRAATPDWLYTTMIVFGVIVLLYHGFKSIARVLAKSPWAWVNLVHALIVGPLLLWVGYHGKRTGRPAYDMLLLTAFAALGFHLYRLIVMSQTFVKPLEA